MFLKLDEIARKLDQIFLPLEQDGITGMRLLPQKDALAFMQAQKSLGVSFPAKFTKLLSKFDLGNFEICNVSFGSRGDYASELVRLNSVDEFGGKWWQGEARPANLIVLPWEILGYFCLIARVVRSMRGYLKMRSFAAGASQVTLKNFS